VLITTILIGIKVSQA